MSEAIRKAIHMAGGAPNLARLVSDELDMEKPLTPMAVRQWVSRGVPGEYCIPLERVLKREILRHELRPDLYPPEEYELLLKVAVPSAERDCSLPTDLSAGNRKNHTCTEVQH
ncbi:MAG TPA: hypothetical protein DEG76_02575 [Pseudohongiella sp.]|nr:hypothetical protein [Pseudohongiella sp.]HBX36240.1 hypothetical protein [Pseudohongiella sp.]|tara:strand:- start:194 stop:532 length:339 start_codon:yes stop_codon:yes gene_type:complete